ncbi:type III secretion system chaperone [Vibrio campbellii]|uniref:Uncharacterized protein n=1 Tax=Vibrio campbellii (strain ATCC BAA-1116) TaxID=2902295 RepID=A7N402_VIBC1|nr:type III secretion system chaperone [Vibrio campbellii]ABU73574.1 hypothetical protein VIBHAR_05673 [Vibrio campbellii ATCC BAA-1116]AGU98642.1 molecular chaperone Tir [Vibrio campbellii ATCC BAA-1116]MBT0122123.1 type III secretion system chaperone [Vibrio campbellii]MBT0137206.1 type III secretion system chaperone [Vibrio campbellii]MBT0141882.1 type III secretion system chaperone [Vibrio campbellii]
MTNEQKIIDNLLQELGRTWLLGFLKLDDSGRCAFKTEAGVDVAIDMIACSSHLQLLADLGSIPDNEDNHFLIRLLHHNFNSSILRQAYFALDPKDNRVLLRYQHPVEGLDVNILANIIGNFTTILHEAKNTIGESFELTNDSPFKIDNNNFIRG